MLLYLPLIFVNGIANSALNAPDFSSSSKENIFYHLANSSKITDLSTWSQFEIQALRLHIIRVNLMIITKRNSVNFNILFPNAMVNENLLNSDIIISAFLTLKQDQYHILVNGERKTFTKEIIPENKFSKAILSEKGQQGIDARFYHKIRSSTGEVKDYIFIIQNKFTATDTSYLTYDEIKESFENLCQWFTNSNMPNIDFILVYMTNRKIGKQKPVNKSISSYDEISSYIQDKPIIIYYHDNIAEYFSYLSHRVKLSSNENLVHNLSITSPHNPNRGNSSSTEFMRVTTEITDKIEIISPNNEKESDKKSKRKSESSTHEVDSKKHKVNPDES